MGEFPLREGERESVASWSVSLRQSPKQSPIWSKVIVALGAIIASAVLPTSLAFAAYTQVSGVESEMMLFTVGTPPSVHQAKAISGNLLISQGTDANKD
ncbi:MAG: hypothetical protein N838_15745 [Thiohalocapsa sp. PB-PSB1]|jgi:hypothetical protein|nr:MAG: hypothetical protein N838_15745 [Thiohalocapsa sp. PB-PSB1]